MDSIPENVKARLESILPGFSARGFNSSGMNVNPNVLLTNKSAILYRYSDELHYLIATYDFDPKTPSVDAFTDVFDKVKVIIIRHSLQREDASAPVHKIPDWVTNFKNVDCLILDNIDLQNDTMLEGMRLKFLGILNAQVKDTRQLVEVIGKMNSLEFLLYSTIFSRSDIQELKKKLPQLTAYQPSKPSSTKEE